MPIGSLIYFTDSHLTDEASVDRQFKYKYSGSRFYSEAEDNIDTADATFTLDINGILQKVILDVPDTTDAVTGQVAIADNGSNTIFDRVLGADEIGDIYRLQRHKYQV